MSSGGAYIARDVIVGVRVARVIERQLLTALHSLSGLDVHSGAAVHAPHHGLTRGLARVEQLGGRRALLRHRGGKIDLCDMNQLHDIVSFCDG